jgi:hypothetical protein
VEIIDYAPQYAADFKRLNIAWLERYFYVEALDDKVLSDPQGSILDGGQIFLARLDDRIVGTCALIRAGDGSIRIVEDGRHAAMPGPGHRAALIERASTPSRPAARCCSLESNSKLAPAISLYASSGFTHAARPAGDAHYQRADVYMEWQGRPRAECSPSAVSRVTIRAPITEPWFHYRETPTPHAFLPDALPADDRSPEPTQARSKQAFERLLLVGEQLLAENRFDEIGVADLGQAGGNLVGTFYRLLGDKDTLSRLLLQRFFRHGGQGRDPDGAAPVGRAQPGRVHPRHGGHVRGRQHGPARRAARPDHALLAGRAVPRQGAPDQSPDFAAHGGRTGQQVGQHPPPEPHASHDGGAARAAGYPEPARVVRLAVLLSGAALEDELVRVALNYLTSDI